MYWLDAGLDLHALVRPMLLGECPKRVLVQVLEERAQVFDVLGDQAGQNRGLDPELTRSRLDSLDDREVSQELRLVDSRLSWL